jgi:hypothetical protein
MLSIAKRTQMKKKVLFVFISRPVLFSSVFFEPRTAIKRKTTVSVKVEVMVPVPV